MRAAVLAALLALSLSALAQAQGGAVKKIEPAESTLTVRVFKTGLFSAFAHEHKILAPIQMGTFQADPASVNLVVDTRQMRVVDPGVSDKERAEVQGVMLGPKVLDAENFPEIRFQSTRVEGKGTKFNVVGDLTIHGHTRQVTVGVEQEGERYRGSATLRQTDFGITPVTVAGGTVKVKDEIKIEFDVAGH